jgi:uncharacterized 2Fe-2S/4Fe-4S cluster protein (DUF4445 family)
MCEIKINDADKTAAVFAEKGDKLSDILRENGFFIDMPCGGNGTCGKCTVTVNGREESACRYIINEDISVVLPVSGSVSAPEGDRALTVNADKKCLVLDIGTSTLALALVAIESGKAEGVFCCANSQRMFGADIMARIEYCRKNGVSKLQSAVISDINRLIGKLNIKEKLPLYVAGNTTMLHIFFGVDCSSLGAAPYTPVFLESKTADGRSLGLNNVSEVISLPCISAFAGADITAGLNYVPVPEGGKYNLLVDLGTNAEIALYNESSCLCTSAAAGPCFEGANISCGMSATEGAVYAYQNGRALVTSGGEAKGICGTGLIDIVAFLLEEGKIDASGFMECGEYEVADGVSVTQEDIRQYQLAKSAVRSATEVLLKRSGITSDNIENVFVSGGFSEGFNVESAVKTGLIPEEFRSRCKSAGNSSMLGGIKYACSGVLPAFIGSAKYIDQADDDDFSKAFIKNMQFGH